VLAARGQEHSNELHNLNQPPPQKQEQELGTQPARVLLLAGPSTAASEYYCSKGVLLHPGIPTAAREHYMNQEAREH